MSAIENLTFPLSGEIFYWGDKCETLQREDADKRQRVNKPYGRKG